MARICQAISVVEIRLVENVKWEEVVLLVNVSRKLLGPATVQNSELKLDLDILEHEYETRKEAAEKRLTC